MAAVWLSGFEESPEDSGEICLVEVFGKDRVPRRSAEVGMGIKKLHDPRLEQDFEAPRLPIDVGQWHEYAVRWDEQRGGVLRGRRARPHLRPPADVPDAGDDRGLRLPRLAAATRSVPALEVEWIGGESA